MTTPEDFQRSLTNKEVPSLVLLYGQEAFLIKQTVVLLRQSVLASDNDDFNDHQFNAKETTASQILEAVMTLPVFAPRKLVTVRDAHQLPAAEMEQLISYLDSPVAETCLLLIADKIDSRRKFYQQFKKHGVVVEFKPLAEKRLPQFVREQLNQRDITISADALALFAVWSVVAFTRLIPNWINWSVISAAVNWSI